MFAAPRRVRALAAIVVALAAAAPASAAATLGRDLYSRDCVTCHGPRGEGVAGTGPVAGAGGRRAAGPSLQGVGALAAHFYLSTGYMPLRDANAQPVRRSRFYTPRELNALVAYVASLGRGPRVPMVHPERGRVEEGLHTFTRFCAGCHQIVGKGGVVIGGSAPALDRATPTQIAEAVRLGPYLMPRFGPRLLTDRQVDSLVRYIEYARDPQDPGGWSLGRLGPIPEGAIAWFIGAAALVAVAGVIGSRAR